MDTRHIPGTDLHWSCIGLGCWAMGGEYWGNDSTDQDATTAIEAAIEQGINWVDTAPLYGKGHADTLIAKALRHQTVAIATKVGVRWDGQHAQSDLSSSHIQSDVENSLKRLGRDHIDLLQVHWPCQSHTPLEESFSTLNTLVDQGKVRYLGVCNYDAASLKQIRDIAPIVSLQTPYSMIRREFESDLKPTCHSLGLASLAYEPLCRGLLTGKYQKRPSFGPEDLRSRDERFTGPGFYHIQRIVNDLRRIATRLDIPVSALSLGWALQRCDFVIAGAKRASQVHENILFSGHLERQKVWQIVDQVLAIHGGVPRL